MSELSAEYDVLNKSRRTSTFTWVLAIFCVLVVPATYFFGLAEKFYAVLEGQKKLEESEHKAETAKIALEAQKKASTETDPLLKRKLEAEAKEAEAKADLAKTRAISQAKIENEARVQQEKAELASETAQKKADMAITQAEASGLMLLREGARLRAKSTITSSLIYENSTGNFKGPSYIQKDSILIIGAITPIRFEVIDFKSNSSIGWIDVGQFGIFFENAK